MSILDVTEDQIFQTLGKGRDPNFKPIEKVRPVIIKPKKTYTLNHTIKTAQTVKVTPPQAVAAVSEPVKIVQSPQVDESLEKLTVQLNELNSRVNGIQKMVKYYIMPQFVIVLILLVAMFVKG
jgi:hypothetical protein